MNWAPLLLSFQVAAIATIVATVVGVALATLLASWRFRGRDLIDVVVTTPMVLPPTVLGYYVLVALGRRSAIGHAFEAITGSSIVFTRTGAIVAASIGSLPLSRRGPGPRCKAWIRRWCALRVRSAPAPLRAFFTVRLPLAAPGILAGADARDSRARSATSV